MRGSKHRDLVRPDRQCGRIMDYGDDDGYILGAWEGERSTSRILPTGTVANQLRLQLAASEG